MGWRSSRTPPDVTHVYVSIGGGGLIAGVATALKGDEARRGSVRRRDDAAPTRWPRALAAGQPVELPAITSIARTLGAPKVSAFTLEHARNGWSREVVVVADAEAVAALVFLLEAPRC